jgi:ABC-type polysaccharide/polyol phosphate export permease
MYPDVQVASLPELVEVNPPAGFLSGPWRIWRSVREHRHLVSNFIQRDLRLKYRSSALGYFWSLLEPLMLSAVYYLLYVLIAGNPEKKHALWIILGVITWQLFAKALDGALCSLTRNEGLIKQVYFPRELFAVTTVGAQSVLAALSLMVAVPAMFYFGIVPTATILLVPVGLILVALLSLGIGWSLACANVVNHDIEHLLKFVTRAGMFLSPVMWTLEKLPKSRSAIVHGLMFNPLVVPITMVRNGLGGRPLGIDGPYVLYSVAVCLGMFLFGAMVFKRYEAEVVKKL